MNRSTIRKDLNNNPGSITGYDLVTDETIHIDHYSTFESWRPYMNDGWEGKMLINHKGHPTLVDNIDFEDANDVARRSRVSNEELQKVLACHIDNKGVEALKFSGNSFLEAIATEAKFRKLL